MSVVLNTVSLHWPVSERGSDREREKRGVRCGGLACIPPFLSPGREGARDERGGMVRS